MPRFGALTIMRALPKRHGRCLAGMVLKPGADRSGQPVTARDTAGALFLISLLLQAAVLAAITAGLCWRVPEAALVAFSGGALALLANLVFGLLALSRRCGAGAVLAALLIAEAGKFVVVAVGFALVIRCFADQLTGLNALLLFGTFGLTLGAQWAAPLVAGFCTDGRRQ